MRQYKTREVFMKVNKGHQYILYTIHYHVIFLLFPYLQSVGNTVAFVILFLILVQLVSFLFLHIFISVFGSFVFPHFHIISFSFFSYLLISFLFLLRGVYLRRRPGQFRILWNYPKDSFRNALRNLKDI